MEEKDCFDIDDYDHRSVLENRSHVKMIKLGEIDEYDRIMIRTQPPSSSMMAQGDVDDWDHRSIVQHSQTSSCTTTHQPRSITMAAQESIRDDEDDLVGGIPAYESYLAENTGTNNDLHPSTNTSVGPDIDDWDHRATQNPPPNLAEQTTQSMEGDIDDFDHRAIYQASATPPPLSLEEICHQMPELTIKRGDVDDYDHRILETPEFAEKKPAVEDVQGDIDDYDHRSLQNPPDPTVERKGKKTKFLGLLDDDNEGLILDSRSKWTLGNLTRKDIEEEREADAKREEEKKAQKEKEAELRRHAWGG